MVSLERSCLFPKSCALLLVSFSVAVGVSLLQPHFPIHCARLTHEITAETRIQAKLTLAIERLVSHNRTFPATVLRHVCRYYVITEFDNIVRFML